MKIIHTADIHLDSRLERHLESRLASERRAQILENFVKMVDYARDNGVAAILISGDLFDVKRISANTKNRVFSSIINNSSIDFFYLQGNHDINSFLDDIDEIPSNLHIFSDKWTSYLLGELETVNITGLEIGEDNKNSLYDSLFLPHDKFNIVMLHGQDSAYSAKDKAEIINMTALRNKNIDYLALGHVHTYKEQALDGRAIAVYSGCFEPRGFDECGDHGFVLLDIDEERRTCSHHFVSFATKRAYEIEADVSDCMDTSDVIGKVEEEIKKAGPTQKDMVKIILCGNVDVENVIDETSVLKRFEDRFFVVKLSNDTKSRINYESILLDKSLKGAFVREVMNEESLSQEEKARIIAYGLAAIRNEEIDLCD